MTVTATEITKVQTDELRAEADSLKVIHERRGTDYANATTHLHGLIAERASLPAMKSEAVLMADASQYTNVLERERAIFGEITIAEVAMAKARVRHLEAGVEWARAYRVFTSQEGQRLGGDYPEGKQKFIDAERLYEGARGTLASLSSALGEAQRSLEEVIRRAQTQLR